jgi:hypothetical protein
MVLLSSFGIQYTVYHPPPMITYCCMLECKSIFNRLFDSWNRFIFSTSTLQVVLTFRSHYSTSEVVVLASVVVCSTFRSFYLFGSCYFDFPFVYSSFEKRFSSIRYYFIYNIWQKIHSKRSAGQVINIVYSVQARLFFLIFYEAKARIFFQLRVARLFILFIKNKRNACFLSHSCLLGQINFK